MAAARNSSSNRKMIYSHSDEYSLDRSRRNAANDHSNQEHNYNSRKRPRSYVSPKIARSGGNRRPSWDNNSITSSRGTAFNRQREERQRRPYQPPENQQRPRSSHKECSHHNCVDRHESFNHRRDDHDNRGRNHRKQNRRIYNDSNYKRNIQPERQKVNNDNNCRNNFDSFRRERFESPNPSSNDNIRGSPFSEAGKVQEAGELEEEGEVQEVGDIQENLTSSASALNNNVHGRNMHHISPKVDAVKDNFSKFDIRNGKNKKYMFKTNFKERTAETSSFRESLGGNECKNEDVAKHQKNPNDTEVPELRRVIHNKKQLPNSYLCDEETNSNYTSGDKKELKYSEDQKKIEREEVKSFDEFAKIRQKQTENSKSDDCSKLSNRSISGRNGFIADSTTCVKRQESLFKSEKEIVELDTRKSGDDILFSVNEIVEKQQQHEKKVISNNMNHSDCSEKAPIIQRGFDMLHFTPDLTESSVITPDSPALRLDNIPATIPSAPPEIIRRPACNDDLQDEVTCTSPIMPLATKTSESDSIVSNQNAITDHVAMAYVTDKNEYGAGNSSPRSIISDSSSSDTDEEELYDWARQMFGVATRPPSSIESPHRAIETATVTTMAESDDKEIVITDIQNKNQEYSHFSIPGSETQSEFYESSAQLSRSFEVQTQNSDDYNLLPSVIDTQEQCIENSMGTKIDSEIEAQSKRALICAKVTMASPSSEKPENNHETKKNKKKRKRKPKGSSAISPDLYLNNEIKESPTNFEEDEYVFKERKKKRMKKKHAYDFSSISKTAQDSEVKDPRIGSSFVGKPKPDLKEVAKMASKVELLDSIKEKGRILKKKKKKKSKQNSKIDQDYVDKERENGFSFVGERKLEPEEHIEVKNRTCMLSKDKGLVDTSYGKEGFSKKKKNKIKQNSYIYQDSEIKEPETRSTFVGKSKPELKEKIEMKMSSTNIDLLGSIKGKERILKKKKKLKQSFQTDQSSEVKERENRFNSGGEKKLKPKEHIKVKNKTDMLSKKKDLVDISCNNKDFLKKKKNKIKQSSFIDQDPEFGEEEAGSSFVEKTKPEVKEKIKAKNNVGALSTNVDLLDSVKVKEKSLKKKKKSKQVFQTKQDSEVKELGNRSIIANKSNLEMKETIKAKLSPTSNALVDPSNENEEILKKKKKRMKKLNQNSHMDCDPDIKKSEIGSNIAGKSELILKESVKVKVSSLNKSLLDASGEKEEFRKKKIKQYSQIDKHFEMKEQGNSSIFVRKPKLEYKESNKAKRIVISPTNKDILDNLGKKDIQSKKKRKKTKLNSCEASLTKAAENARKEKKRDSGNLKFQRMKSKTQERASSLFNKSRPVLEGKTKVKHKTHVTSSSLPVDYNCKEKKKKNRKLQEISKQPPPPKIKKSESRVFSLAPRNNSDQDTDDYDRDSDDDDGKYYDEDSDDDDGKYCDEDSDDDFDDNKIDLSESKRKADLTKPLTARKIRKILAKDDKEEIKRSSSTTSHWVRRSVRQPCRDILRSTIMKSLVNKLKSNNKDMVVLKMKKYINNPDTPSVVIDAALEALEVNTNCQALYIQNFNAGVRDKQFIHLLRVLQLPTCKIWCLNIGETYNVMDDTWEMFAEGLKTTNITHMYASEHTISTALKDQIRATIRKNRSKHNLHNDPENLDAIIQCTHCWWNPINAKSLQAYVKKQGYEYILHDKEAQGLQGTMSEAPS